MLLLNENLIKDYGWMCTVLIIIAIYYYNSDYNNYS